MQVVGTVSRFLFNGDHKKVFHLSCQHRSLKVVSEIGLSLCAGDPISVSGVMIEDPVHGEQLHANEISYAPLSSSLIRGLLKTGSGIGDRTVDRLLAEFGDRLVELLESQAIDELSKVDRITEATATVICDTWHNAKGKAELVQLVESILDNATRKTKTSITNSLLNAYRIYGDKTVDKIKDDPYRIWAFSSWRHAEILAGSLGVKPNDSRRLICAVEEVLHRKLAKGHTVVHPLAFFDQLEDMIGSDLVIPAIIAANDITKQNPPRIIVKETKLKPTAKSNWAEKIQNESQFSHIYNRVYSLAGVRLMEQYVEDELRARLQNNMPVLTVSNSEIDNFTLVQSGCSHGLTDEQKNATRMVLKNSVSVVCGPAGTGKTSVLYCVNDIIKSSGNSVLQVALAGKAAQRLIQQTEDHAYTIKGLLAKIKYQMEKNGTHYLDEFTMPVLHIDEASMIDLQLMYQVLKVFEGRHARFVFIGDPAQLPPIGMGLIFHKLASSKIVPKVELTKNWRSIKDIVKAANLIRVGEVPDPSENVTIEHFSSENDLLGLVTGYYSQCKDINSLHVICAKKATVSLVNQHIHSLVTRERDAISIAPQFSIGDSVIYKKNDPEIALVNGSTGIVQGEGVVATEDGKVPAMRVSFGVGTVMLQRHHIMDRKNGVYLLQHAYAITCHAAQGSEFDTVVIVVDGTEMIERSWLYTALTRAKKKVVLLVHENGLERAITRGFKSDSLTVGFEL